MSNEHLRPPKEERREGRKEDPSIFICRRGVTTTTAAAAAQNRRAGAQSFRPLPGRGPRANPFHHQDGERRIGDKKVGRSVGRWAGAGMGKGNPSTHLP